MALIERDFGLKKLLAAFRRRRRIDVEIGIIGSDAEDDHGELTNAELGTIHEFGSSDGRIPQRSFLRSTVEENRDKYKQMMADAASAFGTGKLRGAGGRFVSGGADGLTAALNKVGLQAVADVQRKIADGIEPPLAESTIARKGSSKPLIDTGQLRRSITHRVVGLK